MDAVNINVFQKTLADHASQSVSYSDGHALPQPYAQPSQNGVYPSYTTPYQAQYSQQYPAPPPQPAPDPLAAFPEEQKALIMRVLSMTPEQINALPPTERSAYIQLRATLGVSTA